MEKVCFRCKRRIMDTEDYFKFIEYNRKKKIREDFTHKLCWNLFLEKIKDVSEARSMIRGMKGFLGRMGVYQEEVKI